MFKRHGMHKTAFYEVWHHMKQRCNGTSNSTANNNYCNRGICYDPNWEKFDGFHKDMYQDYKEGLQLDRRDNNGSYTKDNCRWVTAKINNNNRRDNIFVTHNGETLTLKQWSDRLGINSARVYKRWSAYGYRDFEKLFYEGNLSRKPPREVMPCVKCGRTDGTLRPDGKPRRSKSGLCNTCYCKELRDSKNARKILDTG